MMPSAFLEMSNVHKAYQGLRPLRIKRLSVQHQDRVSLFGFDAAAAEVFVNLVTGASVPDEGEVSVGGTNTRDIRTDSEWLASLDRFGIVTERAVLLEGMPLSASMALPFTLAIDPMPDDVRSAVEALAQEVGLAPGRLDAPVAALSPEERVRVHLARALGPGPALLLLEHPTARLDPAASEAIGQVVQRVARARGLAWVALTADERFARAAGGTRLRLTPATGELARDGLWRRLRG
jgi:predicted ABC-type transport system involved in lysophospholipase L1 biosynthesis ATPase subunit